MHSAKQRIGKLQPYRKLFEEIADPPVGYLALLFARHRRQRRYGARPHSEASALFATGSGGAAAKPHPSNGAR